MSGVEIEEKSDSVPSHNPTPVLSSFPVSVLTTTSQLHPVPVATQLVPSYTFKASFTVSYHKSHSLGLLGAVSLVTQFCFFASSQFMYVVNVVMIQSTSALK